jgi:hypothetical protein
MSKEKDVDKITMHYTDGTTKEIDKGFIAGVTDGEEPGTENITFTMIHIAGSDLKDIVASIVELGFKLGYFNDDDNESEK